MAGTESDVENLRRTYSEFAVEQLRELLKSPADLRPEAVALIEAELSRRGEEAPHFNAEGAEESAYELLPEHRRIGTSRKLLLQSALLAISYVTAEQFYPQSFIGRVSLGMLIYVLLNVAVKWISSMRRDSRK